MNEQVVTFGNAGALVGMVHLPPPDLRRTDTPGIVLLNAGMVHRVGPNRVYVKLARELAARGHVVLRFDFSGFGDSGVRRDHLPMEKCMVDETSEAMSVLSTRFGCSHFILMGLCSGATAAHKTASVNPRVIGTVLINMRAGGDELRSYIMGRSALRKYSRVLTRDRLHWLDAIRRRMHVRRLFNVVRAMGLDLAGRIGKSFPEAKQTASELHATASRGARILILCSEWDPGLDFMKVVLKDLRSRFGAPQAIEYGTITGADHTFTDAGKRSELFGLIHDWVPKASANSRDLKLRSAS